MTYSSEQSTVIEPSETKNCSTCPYFDNFNESNGRGWCQIFDHHVRQDHEQTNDCVLSSLLSSDSESEREIDNDSDSENTITNSTSTVHVINLTDCIPDITTNIIYEIYDSSEHYLLPYDIFEDVTLQAINDLIDDFALNPHQYLKPQHHTEINRIADEYFNS